MLGPVETYVAITDRAWFDFLSHRAGMDGRLDEVNFWSPSSSIPLRKLRPGWPVFFRLKSPWSAIVGYGFFAHFALLELREAWSFFEWKNGDPHEASFLGRIGKYRGLDLLDPRTLRQPLGCTILRDAHFWPQERWIAWGAERGWHANVVRGRTERDPVLSSLLVGEIALDHQEIPEEFADAFVPLDSDQRAWREALIHPRIGQGAFRARLLDAYGGQCAITGEHTRPVLDAAHIQPYLGPRSNHVQNGLLLTKEFHALYDRGYVTVTAEHEVRISPRLRTDFDNGRRYYPYDGQGLAHLPAQVGARPSPEALGWHAQHVFLD